MAKEGNIKCRDILGERQVPQLSQSIKIKEKQRQDVGTQADLFLSVSCVSLYVMPGSFSCIQHRQLENHQRVNIKSTIAVSQ